MSIDNLVRVVLNDLAATREPEVGRKRNAKFWVFFPRDVQALKVLQASLVQRLKGTVSALDQETADDQGIVLATYDGDSYHFLLWDGALIVGTAAGFEAAAKVIKSVAEWREIVTPFLEGYAFRKYVHNYLSNLGLITGYSASFQPFRTFTGYGITMRLWGAKSDEILNGIKTSYSVTPTSIEAEVRLGEKGEFMKVVMSNDGRIRLSTDDVTAASGLLNYYIKITKETQASYEYDPLHEVVVGDAELTELTEEFLIYHSPERDKAGSWSDSQLRALKDLVTAGGMGYGFVGYLTDQDSANVVDLREHKTLMMTFAPEGVSVVARNPSSAQESMKRLHRQIALHIDPFVDTVVRPIAQE